MSSGVASRSIRMGSNSSADEWSAIGEEMEAIDPEIAEEALAVLRELRDRARARAASGGGLGLRRMERGHLFGRRGPMPSA